VATNSIAISKDVEATSLWQGAVVVLGRFFFALIFVFAAPSHFTKQTINFSASQGVRLAWIAVPLSGVVGIAGGLSIFAGLPRRTWRLAHRAVPDSGHVDSHAAVRTDLVYSRRTKSSIAWLTSWARSCWVQ
jgi:hypothetical protein